MKKYTCALLVSAVATALSAPAARAYIRTSGGASFDTGTPTPTIQITAPITLTIATTGNVSFLAFDEWVTNDGSATNVLGTPSGQLLSYTLAGTAGTASITRLADNLNGTLGSITANDGYIVFTSSFNVTAGQTLTIQPDTFTFGSNSNFNPNTPLAFTGNIYLANNTGMALTAPTSVDQVPEPSTWAALLAGAGMLGFALRRRRA